MWSVLLLLAACDARIAGGPADNTPGIDAPVATGNPDAGAGTPDAPPDAAPLGPWGKPAKLTVAAVSGKIEDDETLSSNGLEMVFAIVNPAQNNQKELFYTKRSAATTTDWSTPVKLAINSGDSETPRFSPNDLTLYFASNRGGMSLDIYQATRGAAGSPDFNPPTRLGGVSSLATDKWYMPCPDGSNDYLMAQDTGDGNTHLVEGKLGLAAKPVAELDATTGSDTGTFLTRDCLTLYFASTRSGRAQLYTSKRTAVGMPWSKPTIDPDFPLTGTDNQEDPWMASDLRTFVFVSDAGGDKDVYISTR
ncbi:MAG TPA: hypothetical protein VFP84_32275 [Kofleriaceae bacterium]|nr:hypothetical protein [Kofleriaceae bacterium]